MRLDWLTLALCALRVPTTMKAEIDSVMVADSESLARYHGEAARARVVIIYRNALFARGIASLLRVEGTRDVLGLSAGEPSAAQRVLALEPAVVILEGQHEDTQCLLVPLLDEIPWVIRVGLDGTPVEIYRHAHLVPDRALVRLVTRLARRTDRQRVET